MSYGGAAALQAAIYQRLLAHDPLTALVGTAIHDAVPPGQAPGTYVLIGPEEVRDASDRSGPGAEHMLTVSVMTGRAGFAEAKAAAVAVSDALAGAELVLARGRLVGLWFVRAKAARAGGEGGARRIEMTFRARVEG